MTAALAADSLVKRFGSVEAVSGVSLTVGSGEVVGLLGPNGAGKTTTLRMLAGILTPTEGQVRVGGINFRERPIEAKRRIGFLSGDTQLYQRLSPREVLLYFGRLYDMDDRVLARRAGELIDRLEMGPFADRACGTLSSGQKQLRTALLRFLLAGDTMRHHPLNSRQSSSALCRAPERAVRRHETVCAATARHFAAGGIR